MRDHASAISYIEKLINRKSGLTDYELAELYSDTALCHAYLGHTENGYKYINQALELNEHDAEIRIAAGRFFTIEAQKKRYQRRGTRKQPPQCGTSIHTCIGVYSEGGTV